MSVVCRRIILPLDSDKPAVVEDLVTDHASYGFYAELPNINPAFKGKDYSFAYVGSVVRPSPFINQVRGPLPSAALVQRACFSCLDVMPMAAFFRGLYQKGGNCSLRYPTATYRGLRRAMLII